MLVWLLISVAAAGFGINYLFKQHVLAQLQSELNIHLDQLTAVVHVDDAGVISLGSEPADPRFDNPFSGLYWQINAPAQDGQAARSMRSRSLWDKALDVAHAQLRPGHDWQSIITGPDDEVLQLRAREIYPAEGPYDELVLAVGADQDLLAEPLSSFRYMLILALGVLLLGVLLAAWLQVRFGLQPMRRLGASLQQLRQGQARLIQGSYPAEVQPLVDDFNMVLKRNADNLEFARMQAGNLAHALKTPMAIMTNAAASNDPELAPIVSEQLVAARRNIDYYLARARAAAAVQAHGLSTPVLPLLNGLVRVLQKLYAERELVFDLSGVSPRLAFKGDAQDFQEMLGNVLDNAGKWARHRIVVSAEVSHNMLLIHVDDDGPGLELQQHELVFQRGQRLDERIAGSGLGLAIVQDLATAYGGYAQIGCSELLGGARATLGLPLATGN